MKYIRKLNETFLSKYKEIVAPFGPVGYIVYKRTYARQHLSEQRTEEWDETVGRVVNGLLDVGGAFTQDEAETLFHYIFNLKCSPGGRHLWQLGTKVIQRVGADSLQNCWQVAIDDPIEPFCFAFNELMLGGGVGFNIMPQHVYAMPEVKYDVDIIRRDDNDVDFIVPDNREGWVELLRRILTAFFYTGRSMTYSTACIRARGKPIKTFGGTASGSEDLVVGLDHIVNTIKRRIGHKLRPIDCLDIVNIIGSIVVAGNVRRSAEITLGDPLDPDFIDAKNWNKITVPDWRQMSNNSVVCDSISTLPDSFWSGLNGEGEPNGLFNLKNSRRYGRITDGLNYRPDSKVTGMNPCVSGDTLIYTSNGLVPAAELVRKPTPVLTPQGYYLTSEKGFFSTGIQELFEVQTETSTLKATAAHRIQCNGFTWTDVGRLSFGDRPLILQTDGTFKPEFIVSIKRLDFQEVFDCQVPGANMYISGNFVSHNCGEITLEPYESCNLLELFLPNIDNINEFALAAELMYKCGKIVSCVPFSHPKTQEVVTRNHRIGVGATGMLQALHWMEPHYFDAIYKHIEVTDKLYSKVMKCDESIKLTTVKPSGTLSLLAGVTPGIHPAFSDYYIRRIRFAADDPLVALSRERGFHVEPRQMLGGGRDMKTMIVEYPIKTPDGTVLADELTAVEQLDYALFMQTYWSDNSVSVTVYYSEEEIPDIKTWLFKHYDEDCKSLSFLLRSGHGFKQAPLEAISFDKYNEMTSNTKPITKVLDLKETGFADEVECAGGFCPVK